MTCRLAEVDGAELTALLDDSQLKKFFTHNEGVHSTRAVSLPSTAQEQESEEFEELGLEALAGRTYIDGRWMYLVTLKDWENRSWVPAEDKAGSKEPMDKWNPAHPVPADHPYKQSWERRIVGEGKWVKGGKGRDQLHGQ